jgi:hypothetical protein
MPFDMEQYPDSGCDEELNAKNDFSSGSINRLPTELLIELFTFCVANDPIVPLTLASVSHRFRQVVLSSPRIWQLISLDDRRSTISTSHTQVQIWIAQSDPLPFDVALRLQSSDALLSLVSPLLSSVSRWRHFWISGAKQERLQLSSLFRRGLVPALHYLNVVIQSIEDSASTPHNAPSFYSCGSHSQIPQHISMNISLTTLPSPNFITPIQFTALNITEMSLKIHLQPGDLLKFLTVCPLLEEFYYSGMLRDEVSVEKLQVVQLPHLRVLLIRNTCFQRTILSGLDTPALRELYLQNLNLDFELQQHSATEDGDSDEENPDFSRSPWSDHHTGMTTLQSLHWTRLANNSGYQEWGYANLSIVRTHPLRFLTWTYPICGQKILHGALTG